MLSCFNIDNVSSSRSFFIKPNSRVLGLRNEWQVRRSQWACIYDLPRVSNKEICIFPKSNPLQPPEAPMMEVDRPSPSCCLLARSLLLNVCVWLPSSVRDGPVNGWSAGLLAKCIVFGIAQRQWVLWANIIIIECICIWQQPYFSSKETGVRSTPSF